MRPFYTAGNVKYLKILQFNEENPFINTLWTSAGMAGDNEMTKYTGLQQHSNLEMFVTCVSQNEDYRYIWLGYSIIDLQNNKL